MADKPSPTTTSDKLNPILTPAESSSVLMADVAKLHAESLQLRNQQFQLSTLALVGSGLTAWLAPGITIVTQNTIPQKALVGGTVFWLILLFTLYVWSLALRNQISIISQYLDLKHLSEWEPDFREFNQNKSEGSPSKPGKSEGSPSKPSLYRSQTVYAAWAFAAYGTIVVGGTGLAAWAAPGKVILSFLGGILLAVTLLVYLSLVYRLCHRRDRGSVIRERWVDLSARLKRPLPPAAEAKKA